MNALSEGSGMGAMVASGRSRECLVDVRSVTRLFGQMKALTEVTLAIAPGEKLSLVGHNGAGKSTLMNILSGVIKPSDGVISVDGSDYPGLTPQLAQKLGIRCVFQELSLCPNLTGVENTLVKHEWLAGLGWRKRATSLITSSLDRIFPDHSIDVTAPFDTLSIAQRQMIEIAQAFAKTPDPVRLVILDEPTSSLDAKAAKQLLAFLDEASRAGIATILISHRLPEVLEHADRVVVMVNGHIVGTSATSALTRETLIDMMGHLNPDGHQRLTELRDVTTARTVLACEGERDDPLRFVVRQGEIVGFAGLDGHGQRAALKQIYAAVRRRRGGGKRQIAYVAGDRQTEGVFPLWSVARNTSIRALSDIARYGIVDLSRERALVSDWFEKIGVRAAGTTARITTLSGGNQQKVLFARVLASLASLILLDDPMRGVDFGTKSEVYALIHREAKAGRSFVWYSTEMEELQHCDRVYVFRDGHVVAILMGDEINEENLLHASFMGSIEAQRCAS